MVYFKISGEKIKLTKFNEDSRVKIPAIVQLTRLGYTFIPKVRMRFIHEQTCIFKDLFKDSISKINGNSYSNREIDAFLSQLSTKLDNKDLGKAFFDALQGNFDCKLIDFNDFDNNTFSVVTELTYKNGEDEFRPDITVLINGMPLAFIEVKKPNNIEGMLAERNRINARFKNPAFNRFMNITQLLIFSNNLEYDDENADPVQGAFYAAPDFGFVKFNRFREEDSRLLETIASEDPNTEKLILQDTNLVSCLSTSEYETNKDALSPTNRILTSLLSRSRLRMILKYALVYVRMPDEAGLAKIEKHVMRYPQIFATYAIERKLNEGLKKGIIWHTQGSGKTALAYYNVRYLRDYFQKQRIITKFYFIVDRLDLAQQASDEFKARGLRVELVGSKDEFIKNIGDTASASANKGEPTITVVNIQKFSTDSVAKASDYRLNIQRVYFLDEVHRSYNPGGSFLANLMSSDRDAILIGLTGTPLISGEFKSREIFGDYIHTYYYNKSISDGYTLRMIREGIETSFRSKINQVYDEIVAQGTIKKEQVFAHRKFVKPLVEYILKDFRRSRVMHGEDGLGGMIVCDSSEQARMIYDEIVLQNTDVSHIETQMAAEKEPLFPPSPENVSAALILYDEGTKQTRKEYRNDFKRGGIDLLVVYNMLLTGFDAPRLKKLYLMRKIEHHNLLQTLTRVNRPYKKFKYGFVVDFADIRSEFDRANRDYLKELNEELGDEAIHYSNLFKSTEEIVSEIEEIKERLFLFPLDNLEYFQRAISAISDKKELHELRDCIEKLKSLYNVIKVMGYTELLERFEFDKVSKLLAEVEHRIGIINLNASLVSETDNTGILNLALDSIEFVFTKISESELKIADKFRAELEKARLELEGNFDKKDPQFLSLLEELKRIFRKKGIEELTAAEMNEAIDELEALQKKAKTLNDRDGLLADKYEGDAKFVRVHKRVKEHGLGQIRGEAVLNGLLLEVKHRIDGLILDNRAILANENYFSEETKTAIIETLEAKGIRDMELVRFMNGNLAAEYIGERAA
jgi:type I restriction enzyme, R subunit